MVGALFPAAASKEPKLPHGGKDSSKASNQPHQLQKKYSVFGFYA